MIVALFGWMPLHLLYERVGKRVDQLVRAGLVEEAREMFVLGTDYVRGIRRAIGAPEMETYFMVENDMNVETTKSNILANAIEEIKINT